MCRGKCNRPKLVAHVGHRGDHDLHEVHICLQGFQLSKRPMASQQNGPSLAQNTELRYTVPALASFTVLKERTGVLQMRLGIHGSLQAARVVTVPKNGEITCHTQGHSVLLLHTRHRLPWLQRAWSELSASLHVLVIWCGRGIAFTQSATPTQSANLTTVTPSGGVCHTGRAMRPGCTCPCCNLHSSQTARPT